jgi:hypothetical protein
VSIGIDKLKNIKAYVIKNEMNWINLHENKTRDISKDYWVKRIPSYFLIDKNGIVLLKNLNLKSDNIFELLDSYIVNKNI